MSLYKEKRECLTFDDVQIMDKYSEIEHRSDCDVSTRFTKNFRTLIPIVSSPMDTVTESKMACALAELGGVGVIHRFGNDADFGSMSVMKVVMELIGTMRNSMWKTNFQGQHIPVAVAVGATKDYLVQTEKLLASGANVILIDVAKGNCLVVKKAITEIKKIGTNFDVVAGNVATREGARNLCEWGVDAIRVGIGSGSVCETRIRTGVGVPQITAIEDCADVAMEYDVPIIADGGIRWAGDVAKAIAAGADTVMIGRLFSGTDESPGEIIKLGEWGKEQKYKKYRGSASRSAKLDRGESDINVEGTDKLEPYKGSVREIVLDILDGLRSSMSYVGAKNIAEFKQNAALLRVTSAGTREAYPHALLD